MVEILDITWHFLKIPVKLQAYQKFLKFLVLVHTGNSEHTTGSFDCTRVFELPSEILYVNWIPILSMYTFEIMKLCGGGRLNSPNLSI